MSASIFWRPIDAAKTPIGIRSGSVFVSAMDEVFGPAPWRVGPSDVRMIRAMSAACRLGNNDFRELAETIERVGCEIEVWAVY